MLEVTRLPMGIAGSPDLLQTKIMELVATLEFLRAYIDDLLCITKGTLGDHMAKLEMILVRLEE